MSYLPIVERELGVTARRRGTFRLRWWTTLLAAVVCWVATATAGFSRSGGSGHEVFKLLTSFAFALSLASGIFLTADCISEEKRAGTLGFLFLTDLKSYDVVLGKFAGAALIGFYALFALVPVTALPLLQGGVTFGEFWRVALALVNAMFISLAAGVLVSTLAWDAQRAMFHTAALVLMLTGGFVAIAALLAVSGKAAKWFPWVEALSPTAAFSRAPDLVFKPGRYWSALGTSHLVGWFLLAASSSVLPRTWQASATEPNLRGRFARWQTRRRLRRGRKRRANDLLEKNPVAWLAFNRSSIHTAPWILAVATLVWVAVVLVVSPRDLLFLGGLRYATKLLGFLLKVLFAIQVCQFLTEARKAGALDLLFSTPLTSDELVRGQVLALLRVFKLPVIVFLGAMVGAPVLAWLSVQSMGPGSSWVEPVFQWVPWLVDSVRMLADLSALCWVGMWLSFSLRRVNLAPALTILFVLVLPSMLCWLDLVADLILIAWARGRLKTDLRWHAATRAA